MTLFTFLTSLGCTAILERQEWSQSLATCQKKSHDQAKTKIPDFRTSSALGYNLLFSLGISESL